ncbi:MAG: hypothetical protein AAF357_11540, partial [Verrucomicrobiota bacterium]
LRSWEKFLPGPKRYVILGHQPDWLVETHNLTIHDLPDPYRNNKDANLISKLCHWSFIDDHEADPFIFCSDDQGLLRRVDDFDFAFQPWQGGTIKQNERTKFRKRLWSVGSLMRRQGVEIPKFMDCHIPYLLRKSWCQRALEVDFGNQPGYTVCTLMHHLGEVHSGPYIHDFPIRAQVRRASEGAESIRERFAKSQFWSLFEKGARHEVVRGYLEELLPEPAEWEND